MERYETRLGYLSYDGDSDRLSFPIELRERHLTPETRDAAIQAVGLDLQISIWSERDDIVVRIPLSTWRSSGVMKGTLTGANRGILLVGRFEDEIANEGDEVAATVITHQRGKDELLQE